MSHLKKKIYKNYFIYKGKNILLHNFLLNQSITKNDTQVSRRYSFREMTLEL